MDTLVWINDNLLAQLAREQTNVHRLASTRSGWIERYGDEAVLCLREPRLTDAWHRELLDWGRAHGLDWRRVFLRHVAREPDMRAPARLLIGPAPDGPRVVLENGLWYHVHPEDGYSTGLFPDQRGNRAWLVARRPGRVLNCFAYTCSFSVVAASAGAATCSLDLSKKILARGRENFTRNNLTLMGQRFLADDVRAVLPRLARRGERYDAIILDPPTFARGRGVFRVEREMPGLAAMAWECLAPGGWLLLSTNSRNMDPRDLGAIARKLGAGTVEEGTRPADIPPADMPATLWARKSG